MNTRERFRVLTIGGDLTSRGGIASVIKVLFLAYSSSPMDFYFKMLKTSDYKHGTRLKNISIGVLALLKALYWLIFDRNIRILHIHSSGYVSFWRKSLFVGLGFLWRKKIILHLHASRFDDFFINTQPRHRRLIAAVFMRCDVILVLCQEWKVKLGASYPEIADKVQVVPNPVVLPENVIFRDTNPLGIKHILFLAFLIPSKGIDSLLKIVELSSMRHPEWIFHVAGVGELEKRIVAFAEKFHNIDFVGWADEARKEFLFGQADVLFLPSKREGMPITILEAMSYGVPFVSTNIAGIPDIIGNNKLVGRIFAPDDISGFMTGLEFYNDAEVLRRSRVEVLNQIQCFSNKAVFSTMRNLYYHLLVS